MKVQINNKGKPLELVQYYNNAANLQPQLAHLFQSSSCLRRSHPPLLIWPNVAELHQNDEPGVLDPDLDPDLSSMEVFRPLHMFYFCSNSFSFWLNNTLYCESLVQSEVLSSVLSQMCPFALFYLHLEMVLLSALIGQFSQSWLCRDSWRPQCSSAHYTYDHITHSNTSLLAYGEKPSS